VGRSGGCGFGGGAGGPVGSVTASDAPPERQPWPRIWSVRSSACGLVGVAKTEAFTLLVRRCAAALPDDFASKLAVPCRALVSTTAGAAVNLKRQRESLRLLRSFTLRVNTSGCCAAGQTTQNDGLPHGKPFGNRRI
jgi:hypothetical protein